MALKKGVLIALMMAAVVLPVQGCYWGHHHDRDDYYYGDDGYYRDRGYGGHHRDRDDRDRGDYYYRHHDRDND